MTCSEFTEFLDAYLEGDLAPLLPWLRLGQWLHVGKNATMGMGHYALHH